MTAAERVEVGLFAALPIIVLPAIFIAAHWLAG